MIRKSSFQSLFVLGLLVWGLIAAEQSFAVPAKSSSKNQIKNPTLVESTWLMPQVSVVMPSTLTLSNPNFEVDYAKQFPSLTQAALAAVTPISNVGGFRILSIVKLGFSYKAGVFEMNRIDGEVIKENLKLSWVPMTLGAKFIYTAPDFPYIKPSVTFGGGAHWFYQTIAVVGSNTSFWVPYYFVTPALSFLEGTTPSDWFGGFTFGVTYQQSLNSKQQVRGVSFDMGVNILL